MGEILIEPARGAGVEQVFSRCCGCYVCELVQEQTGQVLASSAHHPTSTGKSKCNLVTNSNT